MSQWQSNVLFDRLTRNTQDHKNFATSLISMRHFTRECFKGFLLGFPFFFSLSALYAIGYLFYMCGIYYIPLSIVCSHATSQGKDDLQTGLCCALSHAARGDGRPKDLDLERHHQNARAGTGIMLRGSPSPCRWGACHGCSRDLNS